MSRYTYVNVQAFNNATQDVTAIAYEDRSEAILMNDRYEYVMSVDRFFIDNAYLPIYESTDPLIFTVTVNATGDTFDATAPLPNQFYYNFQDIVNAFNVALNTACSNAGCDVLTMSFSNNLFSFNSIGNFNVGFKLSFNKFLKTVLNTFQFDTNGYVMLKDGVTQQASTLEYFSPVSRIILKTNIPMYSELTPPITDNSNININTSQILTDYKYYPLNASPYVSIVYNANGNYRYASVKRNLFSQFYISFHWLDYYTNQEYPITLAENCVAEAKVLFKRLE